MKVFSATLLGSLFLATSYVTGITSEAAAALEKIDSWLHQSESAPARVFKETSLTTVEDVVTKALAFKASLTTTQQSTLQQTYTTTLARKWSNLPCGSGCRNGIQVSTLNAAQLSLALEVVKAAAGSTTHEGASEFGEIRLADNVLKTQYGANGYDSTIYFIAFLNTPSTTGAWMLQFGGHHYAANIGFNGGKVVGPTPQFRGTEPTTFTVNGTTYAPLGDEVTAFRNMLASFTTAQLATAKNASTFDDVLLAPGESNNGSGTFPTTKAGIAASTLNTTQQQLVLAAIEPYIQDLDATSAATLRTLYAGGINGTYITWTGNGTSGTPSSFLTTNTNYVRIDGPDVWVEFVCQNGVVIQNQIHYHTVYRDHTRDYGADLTLTTLPVSLSALAVRAQGNNYTVSWNAGDESNISHYEIERSSSSRDGFVKVGQTTARNLLSATYAYTDNALQTAGTAYYRLKIIQFDGSFRYSDVIAVKTNYRNTLTLSPNPVKNILTVSLGDAGKNATVSVNDLTGATLLLKKNQNDITTLDVRNLKAGKYWIRVNSTEKTLSASFVKQ